MAPKLICVIASYHFITFKMEDDASVVEVHVIMADTEDEATLIDIDDFTEEEPFVIDLTEDEEEVIDLTEDEEEVIDLTEDEEEEEGQPFVIDLT